MSHYRGIGYHRFLCVAYLVLTLHSASRSQQTLEPGKDSSLVNLQEDSLYCGSCGTRNEILSSYCLRCGAMLDKTALVRRLKERMSQAASNGEPVEMSSAEMTVLVDAEVDRRVQALAGGRFIPRKHKSETEKVLDVVAPVVTVAVAVYLMLIGPFR